jgi:RNA-directed DNA polymerase
VVVSFDRVNHDILMSRVAQKVSDKRILGLVRRYLQAGVLERGLVETTHEGTPQGGPLSPLLSNILLTDLDRELERRGHRFVRARGAAREGQYHAVLGSAPEAQGQ